MPQKSLRVKSRFEASENISSTARKIERNTRKLNKSMKRGFRESRQSALKFKSVLSSILAASVIQKGFGLLGRGVRTVSTGFVDFGNTITEAALKFGDIGPRAENFNEKLKEIEISARNAAAVTKFTAPQTAQALLLMAKGGFTSAEAMGALRGQIDFAIASGEEFELSTRISTKLLGAFGLNVKNTEQKIKNLNLVNDTLTATVNNSSIGLEELFDAMKDIGPVARNLNTDIVDVAAMAGVLGKEGLDATKAMTGMRSLFLNLAAPSTQGRQILQALGLTLDNGAMKAKNMTGFLFELTKATKDFSETQRAQIFRGIFGKTGIAAATILSQGADKVENFKNKIKGSTGEVKLMSKVMQTTLKGRILELGSTLTEVGFKVLDPFENRIKNNIIALTDFFRTANPQPLIDALNAVAKAAQTTLDIIKKVTVTDITKAGEAGPATKAVDKFISDVFTGKKTLLSDAKLPELLPTLFDPAAIKRDNQAIKNKISGLFNLLIEEVFFTRRDFLTVGGKTLAEIDRENITAQPNIETPPQPNLNVNVQNNIKGNDVEVETEVEAPKTSGGQGRNKI